MILFIRTRVPVHTSQKYRMLEVESKDSNRGVPVEAPKPICLSQIQTLNLEDRKPTHPRYCYFDLGETEITDPSLGQVGSRVRLHGTIPVLSDVENLPEPDPAAAEAATDYIFAWLLKHGILRRGEKRTKLRSRIKGMTEIVAAVAGVNITENERFLIPTCLFVLTIVTDDFMEKADILTQNEAGFSKQNAVMEHLYSKDARFLDDVPEGVLPNGLRPAARAFFDLKERARILNEADPDGPRITMPGLDLDRKDSESTNAFRAMTLLQMEKRRLHELPEGTFKYIRSYEGSGAALLSGCSSLLQQPLPHTVLTHLYYRRLVDTFSSLAATCNDVVGMKKEMEDACRVNLVLFRAVKKGITVEAALKEVLAKMTRQVTEIEFLVDRLMTLFPDVEELDRTIETARRLVDAYGFLACKYSSERYGVVDYKLIP